MPVLAGRVVYIFVQMLWFQATWSLNGISSTGVFGEPFFVAPLKISYI